MLAESNSNTHTFRCFTVPRGIFVMERARLLLEKFFLRRKEVGKALHNLFSLASV
jgi:hypothetical protein